MHIRHLEPQYHFSIIDLLKFSYDNSYQLKACLFVGAFGRFFGQLLAGLGRPEGLKGVLLFAAAVGLLGLKQMATIDWGWRTNSCCNVHRTLPM